MSWRRAQHLVCRGSGYQVRFPIPADIQSKLHRKEFRWSVRTKDLKTATDRAVQATLAFRQLCDKVRSMKKLGIEEAQQLARQFYEKLVSDYKSPGPIRHDEPDIELGHQEVMAEEEISSLEAQVQSRAFTSDIARSAVQHANAAGYKAPSADTDEFRAICEGIARAQMEFARYTLYRQTDRLSDYQPNDALFASSVPSPRLQSIAIGNALTLEDAVAAFFAAKTDGIKSGQSSWKISTLKENDRLFQQIRMLWGDDMLVSDLTADHVREARDYIKSLKRSTQFSGDLKKMRAVSPADRVSAQTASKYFSHVKSFLAWLEEESHIDKVPGPKLKIVAPKKTSGQRKWTSENLEKLFTSPLYTGFHSPGLIHKPGSKKSQNRLYWFFLLGLYTGARQGELLQLEFSHIHLDAEVPHLKISSDLELKTKQSERIIPLHPDLLLFGFDRFVEKRRKKTAKRLFSDISFGPEGNRTVNASKALLRYIQRIGIDPSEGAVFHAFRHNFIDAMRNAEVPDNLARQITGHAGGDVHDAYGSGANLVTLGNQIAKLEFGLSAKVKEQLENNALK